MSFVHEDADFQQLVGIVARDTGIAAALIEKDYWVTHTVTLFEKLDAMARRYARDGMEADAFDRHYEDAAQIIRAAVS